MVRLRDGTEATDSRLGRLVAFDERSRGFPVRAAEMPVRPRSYSWRITVPWVIDQGSEGACVGFAVMNELQARPFEVKLADQAAAERKALEDLYWEAQKIDQWAGGAYPGASPRMDGTSVLAGMKIAQRAGWFRGFRWAFGLPDLVHGIGWDGPAVIGVNWHQDMYRPRNGWVRPTGPVVGGHAILVRAVRVAWQRSVRFTRWFDRKWDDVDLDRSYAVLRNSWGPDWGDGGDARITLRDLGVLLDARGEAVFAVGRSVRPREVSEERHQP